MKEGESDLQQQVCQQVYVQRGVNTALHGGCGEKGSRLLMLQEVLQQPGQLQLWNVL